MQTHNLKQGTKEWHAHRFNHFNASEAAAMLGLDKKTTRTDLLRIKSTGSEKEFSDWVQKNILDYGHEVEKRARPLIEELIGDTLYPVTGSDGKLSASFDGLTMCETVGFEHKQWNESLSKSVDDGIIPDTHMPQLQQQLMISSAERIIFVVSDGTEKNKSQIDVYPDQEWFERIEAGWNQFEKDLAEYVPVVHTEKPKAEAIMQLPALSIQIKGEVTISNLPQFKEAAENLIASIKTDLQTDDDFANAEAMVKFCAETEKKIEAAKISAIAQTASIDDLMRTMDYIKESLRVKRLALDNLVKTQKGTIKQKIIGDAIDCIRTHVHKLSSEIDIVNFPRIADSIYSNSDFSEAVKNKRTLESLHNATDTKIAEIKINLDAAAKNIREKLTWLSETGKESLFPDLQQLIIKDNETFKLILKTRIEDHERKIEAEAGARLKQQEQAAEAAKKQAEAAAQTAINEANARAEKSRLDALEAQERERRSKEAEEKRIQEATKAEAARIAHETAEKQAAETKRIAESGRKEDVLKRIAAAIAEHIKETSREDIASVLVEAIQVDAIPHLTIHY